MRKIITLLGLICGACGGESLQADLTDFIIPPASYKQTPESLEQAFPQGSWSSNPYFDWLNEEKTRAIFKRKASPNLQLDLTMMEGKVSLDELVIDFEGGTFLGCTASLFNRGDSGRMSSADFASTTETVGKVVADILQARTRTRTGNLKKGIMTSGYVWQSRRGIAALEYNAEAPSKIEFVRLKLAHPRAKGIYTAMLEDRSFATVRKSSLSKNVTHEGAKKVIQNIPMVDQGAKGYCVVASAQRVFEYYGISCDMHQLAQIAKSDPDRGTSTLETNRQLGAIDYLFKTRYKCLAVGHNNGLVELEDNKYVGKEVPKRKFEKFIESSIDDGIPLLWSLELGRYQEHPPLHEQTSGGHMRLIVGVDLDERKLYFSDSWGAGHTCKYMDLDDAYNATSGLFSLVPTQN